MKKRTFFISALLAAILALSACVGPRPALDGYEEIRRQKSASFKLISVF